MLTNAQIAVKIRPNPNTVKVLTVDELRDWLLSQHGNQFATAIIIYDMDQKIKKTSPFYGTGIRKVSKTQVMVNFDYDKSLRKRTNGEEEAAKNGNTWQRAIIINGKLTPITVHQADVAAEDPFGNILAMKPNARTYLRCEFRASESKIIDADGNEIDKADLAPHLKKESHKDRAVQFHTVTLHKIHELHMQGEVIRVV